MPVGSACVVLFFPHTFFLAVPCYSGFRNAPSKSHLPPHWANDILPFDKLKGCLPFLWLMGFLRDHRAGGLLFQRRRFPGRSFWPPHNQQMSASSHMRSSWIFTSRPFHTCSFSPSGLGLCSFPVDFRPPFSVFFWSCTWDLHCDFFTPNAWKSLTRNRGPSFFLWDKPSLS